MKTRCDWSGTVGKCRRRQGHRGLCDLDFSIRDKRTGKTRFYSTRWHGINYEISPGTNSAARQDGDVPT